MKMDKSNLWDYIVSNGIATEKELILITGINGYNVETLNDVIFQRTGYRTVEQIKELEN